jgi:predicted esterase
MPEALATASTLYWIGPHGDLASGPTSMSIGDLASGFGSALAPPSSGSGGFGGGFSGGAAEVAAAEVAAPGEARGARAGGRARVRLWRQRDRQAVATSRLCSPGEHVLQLLNGQPAVCGNLQVQAHCRVLHGAGQTPADALEAFRGGWTERGLVLIAPASKGQTWSILTSPQDLDLESVNFTLAEAYKRCTIDRRRIAVGGFSDGASYALTLGVSNGDLFPAVMALSPGRSSLAIRSAFPASLFHGTLTRCCRIEIAGDLSCRSPRCGYPVTYRRLRGGHEASLAT